MNITPLDPIRSAIGNTQEDRNIAAERDARQRRLDRDRIIRAALDTLETVALDTRVSGNVIERASGVALNYIAGCADIPLDRFVDGFERAIYVAELLSTIRAELSPLSR